MSNISNILVKALTNIQEIEGIYNVEKKKLEAFTSCGKEKKELKIHL